MVTKDEALKMAIEDAMKFVNTLNGYEDANQSKPFKTEADKYLSYASVVIKSLATSLQEALAQPIQEPVAWNEEEFNAIAYAYRTCPAHEIKMVSDRYQELVNYVLSITHPAPSWQGLSNKEVMGLILISEFNASGDVGFARAIEQELKRKNGFNDVKEKNT